MSKPGFLHWLFSPITSRLSLAGRVGVLTTAAVAFTFGLVSLTVYVTVYDEFISSLDDSMFKRAENAVEAGYSPGNLTTQQAEILSITGIQLLTVTNEGGSLVHGSPDSIPAKEKSPLARWNARHGPPSSTACPTASWQFRRGQAKHSSWHSRWSPLSGHSTASPTCSS